MKFIIHGKNVEVTDALREYVEKKLGRVEKYSRHIVDMNVELSIAKNPRIKNNQQVTVTTSVNGLLLRAEESSINMYAAIDLVTDKLERQLKKYERKRNDKAGAVKTGVALGEADEKEETAKAPKAPSKKKIKIEQFAVKPMSPEEAVAQMELLNYTFLLFQNQDSNSLNIIYKLDAKDHSYGLIVPEEAVDRAVVLKA